LFSCAKAGRKLETLTQPGSDVPFSGEDETTKDNGKGILLFVETIPFKAQGAIATNNNFLEHRFSLQ
jgi:hypothetical protein